MDNDSTTSRVERTFWTVWYYITGAVNRFFRPEATTIISNDQNSIQEFAVDSEPANFGHAEGDARGREVDGDQPLSRVSVLCLSRPIVAWEPCTTDIDVGSDEENRGGQSKISDGSEGMRGEQIIQTGLDDAVLLDAEEDKHEGDQMYNHGQSETLKNDEHEEHLSIRSLRLASDVEVGEAETVKAKTPGDHEKRDETMTRFKETEEDNEDEQEVKACTITALSLEEEEEEEEEEEDSLQKEEADTVVAPEEVRDRDGVSPLASERDRGMREVENQLLVCEELSDNDGDFKGDSSFTAPHVELQMANKEEHVMAHGRESDEAEDVNDVGEAAKNQTMDGIKSVSENSQEEDISNVSYGEECMQNAKTEQEDVANCIEVGTEITETEGVDTENHRGVVSVESNTMTTSISAGERLFDQAEEGRLSREGTHLESYMDVACTNTSLTVKPQGEATQEIRGEFKNIPLGKCEGRLVVSQELNPPTCEETQEGVPEYNNEPGPDENTTQRLLEAGDYEEFQSMQLPEEVESLQNSSCSTGADCLLVRERMEEEQEDIGNSFDLVVGEQDTGILGLTDAGLSKEKETGLLFEKEEEEWADSTKTGVEHSGKESEIGLTDETDKATKEEEVTEELLVEHEEDHVEEADAAGGDLESSGIPLKSLEAEVQNMTEISFMQELGDTLNSEKNTGRTSSLLEDFSDSGFLKRLVQSEPKLLEDSAAEDAGMHAEKMDCEVEEEAAGDEMQNNNKPEILNLHEMAAELAIERSEQNQPLIAESLEPQNQLSEDVPKISKEETEAADESMTGESKPEDKAVMSTEQTAKHVMESDGGHAVGPISGRQDVIDEELLDLWIQTALSEDTDAMKQDGPESGQQMATETQPSHEEQDDIFSVQRETDKEQLVELNSVSDTETFSSIAESGFLEQSLCEWGAQIDETELLKSASTGSLQGEDDMLAKRLDPAGISDLSTQQPCSESQDILMEESGVVSPEAGPLNQEFKSQETTDEVSASQRENDAVPDVHSEAAQVQSPTEMSALFKLKDAKVEPLEKPDCPNEIERFDSRSDSEGSLEVGIVSAESESQGDTFAEKLIGEVFSLDKPQPGWSKDIADSLPSLKKAEVAEKLTTESEHDMEVDVSFLDFTAQRSRIAVKNPRVRPPKDPRSLLHMPSVDPTTSPQAAVKTPAGVPLGGLGIGIKLPGLGAGFPVLKKTQQVVRDENNQDSLSQETEAKPEEKSDTPRQDEPQHKPKWMPPRHPGFGNPLMSELKTKLKKTTKDYDS